MKHGQFGAAAAEFSAELDVSPPDLSLHFPLFIATARAGQVAEAVRLYDRIISQYQVPERDQLLGLLALAEAYAANGDLSRARGLAEAVRTRAAKGGLPSLAEQGNRRVIAWESPVPGNQPPN